MNDDDVVRGDMKPRDTFVSGMDAVVCRLLAERALEQNSPLRWLAPDALLQSLGDADPMVEGSHIVWLFCSPAAMVCDVPGDAIQMREALEQWLRANGAALRLRDSLGDRIRFVDTGAVSIDALAASFGLEVNAGVAGPESVQSRFPEQGIVAALIECVTPAYVATWRALCAAAQSTDADADEKVPSPIDDDALFELLAAMQADRVAQQDQTVRGTRRMVQQLHQVQEELEQYYLKYLDLDAQLKVERRARDASGREIQALRVQLQQMQRELGNTSAHARPGTERKTLRARLARLAQGGQLWPRGADRQQRQALRMKLDRIRASGWFDADWYLATYPDVRSSGMDPAEHYDEFGWKEARNPGATFDTAYYLRNNPDVADSGANPLWHFVEHGCNEGRLPRES